MQPNPFSLNSPAPGARLPVRFAVLSLLLASWAVYSANAQSAPPAPPAPVPNAATVPPAAILQKPPSPGGADAMSAQPSPNHVWIAGHWHWNGGQYTWVAGKWELPPIENAVWVAPHWDSNGNGYVLTEGFWQQANSAPMAAEAPPPPMPMPPPMPPAQGPDVVVVNEPPPAPMQEIIVERDRPGRDYIWVNGYWSWSHGRHFWIAGHWDRPPHPGAVWVEPRWDRRGGGYVLVEGYWREPDREPGVSVGVSLGHDVGVGIAIGDRHDEVILREGPPPPRHEYRGPPPSPRYFWIAGYWAWHHGRNEWVEGHWELPPSERAVWVEPRWEHRNGGYVFIEGSWR
jgi:hypothetical protein